jgi:hypothetical protein
MYYTNKILDIYPDKSEYRLARISKLFAVGAAYEIIVIKMRTGS